MKIKITIEYDEETGSHSVESNASFEATGAAIATAMMLNGSFAAKMLLAVGSYLGHFDPFAGLGRQIMQLGVAREIANDELNAQHN